MFAYETLFHHHEAQWRVWFAGLSLFGAAQIDAAGEAQAQPPDATARTPWPAPPFSAWIAPPGVYVRREAKMPSTPLSLLHRGDTVTVQSCQPDCNVPHAWALLQPRGAVPVADLRALPVSPAAMLTSANAQYIYARVPQRTLVFARPDAHAKVLHKEKAEFRLAFAPNPELAKTGWYQRPNGGYMREKDLKFFTPSTFVGEHELQPPFAFVRRKVKLTPPKGSAVAAPVFLQRYDRVKVLGEAKGKVLVPGGSLPRSLVRMVRFYGAPKRVAGQPQVRVDCALRPDHHRKGDVLGAADRQDTFGQHPAGDSAIRPGKVGRKGYGQIQRVDARSPLAQEALHLGDRLPVEIGIHLVAPALQTRPCFSPAAQQRVNAQCGVETGLHPSPVQPERALGVVERVIGHDHMPDIRQLQHTLHLRLGADVRQCGAVRRQVATCQVHPQRLERCEHAAFGLAHRRMLNK